MTSDLDDVLVDDSALLGDRLVRSLHKSPTGHLSTNPKNHRDYIMEEHNVAILYVYTGTEKVGYEMHEHYIYSDLPCSYTEWGRMVAQEGRRLERQRVSNYLGVYGWQTGRVHITPLRNGDLFIKIDEQGAHGVRLSFGPRTAKQTAFSQA
jgi:hypothetical protein